MIDGSNPGVLQDQDDGVALAVVDAVARLLVGAHEHPGRFLVLLKADEGEILDFVGQVLGSRGPETYREEVTQKERGRSQLPHGATLARCVHPRK